MTDSTRAATPVEAILKVWDRVQSSPEATRTRAVFVLGPEGAGRSHVLRSLAEADPATGDRVEARWAPGADFLAPFLKLAGAELVHGHLVSRVSHWALETGCHLLSVVPVVKYAAKVLPIEEKLFSRHEPVDTIVADERFERAYRERVERQARRRGLLGLLDDAQYLEPVGTPAWRFLGRLVAYLADHHVPALLVFGYRVESRRDGAFRAMLGQHFAADTYQCLDLALDDAAAAAMVRERLGAHPAGRSDRFVTALVKLAAGRPTLIDRATRVVSDLGGDDESAWLEALSRLARIELDDLSRTERSMCALHAILDGHIDDRVFGTESFHRYWNVAAREAGPLLEQVTRRMAIPGLREALLEEVPDLRRRQDFVSYANALDESYCLHDDPGLLIEASRCYREAGELGAAAAEERKAAKHLSGMGRAGEALDRMRAVRTLLGAQLSPEETVDLLLEEAEIALRASKVADAVESLAHAEKAIAVLPPSRREKALARCNFLRGVELAHGPNADVARAAERFAAAAAAESPELEARARGERAFCLARQGDLAAAEREARQGVAVARGRAQRADELFCLHLLGDTLARSGQADDEAERCLLEVTEASDATPVLRSQALDSLGNLYARRGRFEDGARRFEQSQELKLGLGDATGLAISYGGLARLYHRHGKLDKAAQYYELDLDLIGEASPPDTRAFIVNNSLRAEVARMSGDAIDAERRLEECAARLAELPPQVAAASRAYVRLYCGRLRLDQGRVDEADQLFVIAGDGVEVNQTLGAELAVGRAGVAVRRNGARRALELLAEARPQLTEDYSRFELERLTAEAAAAAGDGEVARAARERAREIAERLDNEWMRGRLG